MIEHSRVRELRESQGLSVAQLAAKSGLTRQTIYNLERGDRPCPSADVLVRIARALGVAVEDLVNAEPAA